MDVRDISLLLIEDNAGDARFLQELLKEPADTTFTITHATRLSDGLANLSSNHFDIILLDLSLPDARGIETVVRTREAARSIPIVVLTGFDDEAFALKAVREGAQDYLTKGKIEPDLLVRSIRYAVERQRLQLLQEEQEQQIRKLAASVQCNPHPVFELSADGELVYWNDAAANMTRTMGKARPDEILPSEYRRVLNQCLETRQPQTGLETAVADHLIAWSFFPLPGQDIVHAHAMDISERVRLEQQLRQFQKMEAVGQLAAGVAHDFNNFLTIIQGHVATLTRQNPPAAFANSLKQVTVAAESASEMTRQLLTISRQQVIEQQVIELSEILQKLADLLTGTLGHAIEFDLQLEPGIPPILADAGMIQQIVLNLAVNARDAMPDGGVLTLAGKTEVIDESSSMKSPMAKAGKFACICVSDTGKGMDDATVSRIFEPFFSTKNTGKGTGLGLAMVYGIVNQHRGWIDVESEPGRGTTFKIFLPTAEAASTRGSKAETGKTVADQ